MRIAIDARAWGWTGIGRYIRELVREYANVSHGHSFVLLLPSDADAIAQAKEATKHKKEIFSFEIIDGDYYSWGEQLKLPFQLASVKADLFHFPHFNVPIFFTKPYVVTIHDTTRFYFPGQRRRGFLSQIAYEAVFTNAVRSARHVICVSEHTARELHVLRVLPKQPRAKTLSIIHEGVGDEFFASPSALNRSKVRALIGTQDPYILSVGIWMSHKNLPRVLEAFKEVLATQPSLKLVMTGKPVPVYLNMVALAQKLGISENVIFPGFVPHELLPALYKESEALLFPSLYEGFGLPALEAAALGVPVVASNVTSLPEVLGEAGQYVNPEHVEDIVAGLRTVLTDTERRQQLQKRGIEQATTFSWKNCASETLAVYEKAHF